MTEDIEDHTDPDQEVGKGDQGEKDLDQEVDQIQGVGEGETDLNHTVEEVVKGEIDLDQEVKK